MARAARIPPPRPSPLVPPPGAPAGTDSPPLLSADALVVVAPAPRPSVDGSGVGTSLFGVEFEGVLGTVTPGVGLPVLVPSTRSSVGVVVAGSRAADVVVSIVFVCEVVVLDRWLVVEANMATVVFTASVMEGAVCVVTGTAYLNGFVVVRGVVATVMLYTAKANPADALLPAYHTALGALPCVRHLPAVICDGGSFSVAGGAWSNPQNHSLLLRLSSRVQTAK